MASLNLVAQRALGLRADHLVPFKGRHRLGPDTVVAWQRLRRRGQAQGFDLTIASSFRSYERQRIIWDAKAAGNRVVVNDKGRALQRASMSDREWIDAIMRFSALPGTSRHHWGSDLDLYDAAAIDEGYRLRLEPVEYTGDGPFAPLSDWLSDCISRDDAEGFFRPYAEDQGGVAPEPWHVSHRDTAQGFSPAVSADLLVPLWRGDTQWSGTSPLALGESVIGRIAELWGRFVNLGC